MAKKRVLIVDDDPDILDVLRLSLPEEEYEVIEAQDGQEALDKVYQRPPDIIILDYVIPKIDGHGVCQRLKKDVLLRHLPIIMLTGKGDVKDKVKGLDAGADYYMVKPFEPEELCARIRMVLRRSQIDLDAAPLTRLPGNVSIFNEIDRQIKSGRKFAVAYLDLDKVGNTMSVRSRQRGDRFYPLGMTEPKKLGEFMIDAKIPRTWRGRVPVVYSPEQILWVVGYRIDDRVKVTDDTSKALQLEFQSI